MADVDILTQIIRFVQSTTYISTTGNSNVRSFAQGYSRGVEDTKMKILEIINSENNKK